MTLPAGFPPATFTSTSRAPAAVPTGASTWIPVSTPFGAVYGSSQNIPYLNLRPAADTPTGPSTTTYTFKSPTPTAGWGFALGDIDADQVQVSATDGAGNAVPIAGLGFQGVFNFCDATPRSSTCTGQVAPFDSATWDPATGTLIGNAAAADTIGSSGWFQPTVGLKTLTFVFTQRLGFPIYQTWFATLTLSISGTVNHDAAVPQAGLPVTLKDAAGNVIATATTNANGTYSFPRISPGAGYTVSITPPTGFSPDGPTSRTVDLTTTDATGVDFHLVAVYDVPGQVNGPDGQPAPAVPVQLETPAGGTVQQTTTDTNGQFTLDNVPADAYNLDVGPTTAFAEQILPITIPLPPGETLSVQLQPVAEPTTTTAAGEAPGALPPTGSDEGSLAALALAVALLGVATAAVARRRATPADRPHTPSSGENAGPLVADPGCWHLMLAWAGHTDSVDLLYLPAP